MSLTMDPVPPFSHLPAQQQHQHHHSPVAIGNHHHLHHSTAGLQLSPLHHPRPEARPLSLHRPDTSLSREQLPHVQLPLSPTHPLQQTTWSSPKQAPARLTTYQRHPDTNSPSHPPTSSWVLPTPSAAPGLQSQQAQQILPGNNNAAHAPHSHASLPPTPTSTTTMGSIHYAMPPQQYGPLGIDESSLQNQSYHFDHSFRPGPVPQQSTAQQHYDYSQPDTYGSTVMRTSSPVPMASQYSDEYRMPAYSHAPGMAPRTMPVTSMAAVSSSFSTPGLYEPAMYSHQPLPQGVIPAQMPQGMPYSQPVYGGSPLHSLPRSMSSIGSANAMRAAQKPKPQCWDHGCNGRRFSTFSNLLRHQREKSGTATKSYCPRCGAEFTRTTARNGHLAHDKCTKVRKDSESSQ